jgi:hypothetical protein
LTLIATFYEFAEKPLGSWESDGKVAPCVILDAIFAHEILATFACLVAQPKLSRCEPGVRADKVKDSCQEQLLL